MSKQLICSQCGHIGSTETAIKGNGLIEIVLWLFFIIPGVIYSIWRSSSRHKVCMKCSSTSLIPLDSPVGQKIIADQGKTVESVKEELKHEKKPFKVSKGVIIVLIIFVIVAIISAISG